MNLYPPSMGHFFIFNTIGIEMERDIPDFRKFENYVLLSNSIYLILIHF